MLCFRGYGFAGCLSGGCGCGLTLAATYFAWIVRCTTVAWLSAGSRCGHYHFNHFSSHYGFSRSGYSGFDHSGFSNHNFGGNRRSWSRSGFYHGRFGNWLANNACFLDVLRRFFEDGLSGCRRFYAWRFYCRSFDDGFDHGFWRSNRRFDGRDRLSSGLDFRFC